MNAVTREIGSHFPGTFEIAGYFVSINLLRMRFGLNQALR